MKKYLFAQSKKIDGIYLGFIFLLHLTVKSYGQSTLPPAINKIFFETSKFNQPVLLELPSESLLSQFQKISQTPDIYESGLPKATITIGKGVEDYDKYLLSFLVKNGYAKIETKIQTTHGSYGTTSKTYNFLFYSDGFKKNIQYYNVNEYGENKTKPFIKLAHRKIISIDYKNEYEDAPLGMRRTFYSVVFSYSFVNDLSNLPSISRVFKGKGKAFKDPDDGTWKMEGPFENLGIKLDDNSSNEFLNFFRNTYEPFSFEMRASELLSDANKDSIRYDGIYIGQIDSNKRSTIRFYPDGEVARIDTNAIIKVSVLKKQNNPQRRSTFSIEGNKITFRYFHPEKNNIEYGIIKDNSSGSPFRSIIVNKVEYTFLWIPNLNDLLPK